MFGWCQLKEACLEDVKGTVRSSVRMGAYQFRVLEWCLLKEAS